LVLKASGFLNLKQKIYPTALGTQQKISNFTMMEQHSLVRIESLSPAVRSSRLVLMFTLCSSFTDTGERERKNEAPGAYANLGDAAPPARIFIDSCFIYIYFPAQDFPPSRLEKSTDKSTAAHAGNCCCLYMKWVHVRI
jgi:hypothetical protein